jgi:hypothetical protein
VRQTRPPARRWSIAPPSVGGGPTSGVASDLVDVVAPRNKVVDASALEQNAVPVSATAGCVVDQNAPTPVAQVEMSLTISVSRTPGRRRQVVRAGRTGQIYCAREACSQVPTRALDESGVQDIHGHID